MPYAEARQILGPDAIIGISTHTAEQLRAACALRPDYVAIGPVFATSTKALKDPVLGVAGLTALFRLATVPAVAIGGINHENAPALLAAGVRNLACISCIAHATDPAESLDRMLRLFQPSPNRS
jgi:thiamine-phosphate pyrophosphorylase